MKAIVLKRYRDKYTQILLHQGNEIDLTPERLKEINSTAAGALVEKLQEAVVNHARGTAKRH